MSVGNLVMSRSQETRYLTFPSLIVSMKWYIHTQVHTHFCTIYTSMLLVSSHNYAFLKTKIFSSFCLFSVFWGLFFHPLFVAHCLGVPVVMACAVGAAGMAITIHGSLAEAWTLWTYMREGGRMEQMRGQDKTKEKKLIEVRERGMERRWQRDQNIFSCIYEISPLILSLIHLRCLIQIHLFNLIHILAAWKHPKMPPNPQNYEYYEIRGPSWIQLYCIWELNSMSNIMFYILAVQRLTDDRIIVDGTIYC